MHFLAHWLLTVVFLIPLAGAIAVFIVRPVTAGRWIALGSMLLSLSISLLALVPLRSRQTVVPTQIGSQVPLMRPIHFNYQVALDRFSFPFLLLVTLLFPVVALLSWDKAVRSSHFLSLLLLLECSSVGVLIAFDLLLFGLLLIATIAWSCALASESGARRVIVMKLLVHLGLGLACFLVAIALIFHAGHSFDVNRLGLKASARSQTIAAILATVGFLFWLAIVPLHTWLAAVLTECAVSSAFAISVLMPTIGGYGLFRIAGMLLPRESTAIWNALGMLGAASILYGGFCSLAETGSRRFLALNTSSLMGFVLLAFATRSSIAGGGIILLFAAQLLLVALVLYSGEQGWQDKPAISALAWLALLVAPGLLGQVLVVIGEFEAAQRVPTAYGLAIAAFFGVFLGGASAARLIYRQLVAAPSVS